jgi:hypothetical protein
MKTRKSRGQSTPLNFGSTENKTEDRTITYIVLNPNDLPRLKKPKTNKIPLMRGYVIPVGTAPCVPYCIMVHKPVTPPLVSPFGWMNDVHARQKIKVPTEIRK